MDLVSRLIHGSFFRVASLFLQIAISFVMIPFIVHSLGNRVYGFWSLAGAFLGYYGMLNLGLPSAVLRFISRASGTNDVDEMNRVASTAFFLYTFLGFLVILTAFAASSVSSVFLMESKEATAFTQVLIIVGIGAGIDFPLKVFSGILNARLRYDMNSMAIIARLLVANVCIYIALSNGYGIRAMAIIVALTTLCMNLFKAYLAQKALPGLKISLSKYSKDTAKTMFSFGGLIFVANTANILKLRTPPILIAAFLTATHVTFYHIGVRLLQNFMSLISAATGIAVPVFSYQQAKGDHDSIKTTFLNLTRISTIFAVFVGASILFFGEQFINVWMGPQYHDSFVVLAIMAVPTIFVAMQGPASGVLVGTSRQRFFAIAHTGEMIIGLLLSVVLVKFYGIFGVAVGLAIAELIFGGLLRPVYACKYIDLPISVYIKMLASTIGKLLVPLLIWFALAKPHISADYASIFTIAGLQVLIFMPFIYFSILKKEDRLALSKALRTRKNIKQAHEDDLPHLKIARMPTSSRARKRDK